MIFRFIKVFHILNIYGSLQIRCGTIFFANRIIHRKIFSFILFLWPIKIHFYRYISARRNLLKKNSSELFLAIDFEHISEVSKFKINLILHPRQINVSYSAHINMCWLWCIVRSQNSVPKTNPINLNADVKHKFPHYV